MGGDGERDYCVIVIIFHIVDFFLVGRGFFSVLGVFHVKFLCCGDCFLISLISRIFACSCGECGIEFPNIHACIIIIHALSLIIHACIIIIHARIINDN